MPRIKKHHNPFLSLLVLVGIAFCLSAWLMYLVSLRTLAPASDSEAAVQHGWLITLFQDHGMAILAVELLVLAVCAGAAMITDKCWSVRIAAHCRQREHGATPPPPN